MKPTLFLLGLALAPQVFAIVPIIKVTNVTTTQDCGLVKPEVETAPDDPTIQCLRVYFDNFAIASSAFGSTQRNCHMEATLRIPPNTQFRATEAIAEGAYLMGAGSFGGISLRYTWPKAPMPGHNSQAFGPNTQGDFNFKAEMPGAPMTPCLPYESEVKLSSDLHTFIDQRGQGTSLVSLDETGTNGNIGAPSIPANGPQKGNETRRRLSWNWQIAPCQEQPPILDPDPNPQPGPDPFAVPFISHYNTPEGRYYQARIMIAGTTGAYLTNAGFEGQLYNIRRLENGQVAEGEWSAQGATGTFSFRITDPRSGTFVGSWTDSRGRRGNWNGQYEAVR